MAKDNEQYWSDRLKTRESDSNKRVKRLQSEIGKLYQEQLYKIDRDMAFYIQYQLGALEELDIDENMMHFFNSTYLNPVDISNYRNELDVLMQKWENATSSKLKDRAMAEMRLLRTREQMTLYQAMEASIRKAMIEYGVEFEDRMAEFLAEEYIESWQYAHYEQAVRSGLPYMLTMPNENAVIELLSTQFLATDFSEVIWKHSQTTINVIQDAVKDIVIRGKGVKQMVTETKRLLKDTDAIANTGNLKRIIQTESSRCFNSGRTQAMKERGQTHYKILAIHDSKTCKKCEELDGSRHEIENQMLPIHPNCRCTILTDKDDGTRFTQDTKYYMYKNVLYMQEEYDKIKKDIKDRSKVQIFYPEDIGDMSYMKYKQKYVKKG